MIKILTFSNKKRSINLKPLNTSIKIKEITKSKEKNCKNLRYRNLEKFKFFIHNTLKEKAKIRKNKAHIIFKAKIFIKIFNNSPSPRERAGGVEEQKID